MGLNVLGTVPSGDGFGSENMNWETRTPLITVSTFPFHLLRVATRMCSSSMAISRAAAGPAVRSGHGGRHPTRQRPVPPNRARSSWLATARTGPRCASPRRRCSTASAATSTRVLSCCSGCAASTRRKRSPPAWRCHGAQRRLTRSRRRSRGNLRYRSRSGAGRASAEHAEASGECLTQAGESAQEEDANSWLIEPWRDRRAHRRTARTVRVLGRRVRCVAPRLRGAVRRWEARPGPLDLRARPREALIALRREIKQQGRLKAPCLSGRDQPMSRSRPRLRTLQSGGATCNGDTRQSARHW